ncbi:reverse transcriptase domain-containing protein [Tanacetum coccineum]
MPTWCHMFNSMLTGNARVWFDDLLAESIDNYDDLKKTFLGNYLQQKKYIKDPIEIHNIKQRDGKSTEDFVRRYKLESRDVKGAPECMRISGFVHGITNPELIKRLHDKIPKTFDEMMRVTTSFLRGEVAASNHERKKSFPPWKQQKGKFKAPPPMTIPVEKQNHTKFCEFHGEVGHNTNACMYLKKQIEEMLKAGKLLHLIKKLKQNTGKEQPKTVKKGETFGKGKALVILMIQPWEWVARQNKTQSFSPNTEFLFPPLDEDEGTEGPMIIEAEIGGHCIHRMYVDGGSASEILANTTTGEDWTQRTLRFGLDEFHGCKVTIFVQRNYWKTRSQKITSSSVNSSRNAEAPDAYKGYHQIQMAKEDEDKTSFITSQGIFCDTKMPFGLRNTGATYQRLVDKAFHK